MSISKLNLVSLHFDRKVSKEVLLKILELDNFHIEPASKFIEKTSVDNQQENVYEEILNKLTTIKENYGIEFEKGKANATEVNPQKDKDIIDHLMLKVNQITKVIDELDIVITENEETIIQLHHAINLDVSFDDLFSCKYLQIRFGKIANANVEKLEIYQNAPFIYKVFQVDDEYTWCMYMTTPKHETRVDNIFASVYFERIRIPEFVHGSPEIAIAEIQEEIDFAKKEKEKLRIRIIDMFNQNIYEISRIYAYAKLYADTYALWKYVVVTDEHLAVHGFVPKRKIKKFEKQFEGIESVEITIQSANDDLRLTPPTKLSSHWFIKPFRMFVEMYGVPSYDDIDPTLFVAISYTLLFGIMFGDVGQGIVLMIVSFLIFKLKGMQLAEVGIRLGISSAIFGFVFGSIFGNEHILVPIFNPMDSSNTMTLLLVAISIGICLLIISMLLNMYITFRNKELGEFLFDKNGLSGFVFYVGVLLQVAGMMLNFAVSKIVLYLCIIAILLVFLKEPICRKMEHKKMFPNGFGSFIPEGFFELFEVVLSFITNTMSFLRVGGFVLSHAGMMLVVYTLAEMVGGVGYWVVLVIGNIFVMVLEGLIVGIQVLRLEFYEMFSRYYKGNGIPFRTIKEIQK